MGHFGTSPDPRVGGQRKIRFTLKAFRELARLGMGLDEEDAWMSWRT